MNELNWYKRKSLAAEIDATPRRVRKWNCDWRIRSLSLALFDLLSAALLVPPHNRKHATPQSVLCWLEQADGEYMYISLGDEKQRCLHSVAGWALSSCRSRSQTKSMSWVVLRQAIERDGKCREIPANHVERVHIQMLNVRLPGKKCAARSQRWPTRNTTRTNKSEHDAYPPYRFYILDLPQFK